MFSASLVVVLLIVLIPATLVLDGPVAHGILMAATALITSFVAWRLRRGEFSFLYSVVWPITLVAALPVLWMLFQIAPIKALANPVWDSAAATLGHSVYTCISVDPGKTLTVLARYLSLSVVIFIAAAAAIDRYRAKWLLFALIGSMTLVAVIVIATHFIPAAIFLIAFLLDGRAIAGATELSAFGVIFAATAALHIREKKKAHGPKGRGLDRADRIALFASLAAFVICALAVFFTSTMGVYFSVACGVMILLLTSRMRRMGVRAWEFSTIIAVIAGIAVVGVTLKSSIHTQGVTLAFASETVPQSSVLLARRILSETSWTGTGAGTFASMVPVYRDVRELDADDTAPTAAAAIAIEMGLPFLWGIVLASLVLVIALLQRALRRGRDFLYATAGASCTVVAILLMFINSALFCTPILIVIASSIGLAVAQSKSRVSR